jgi:hypothetical protein
MKFQKRFVAVILIILHMLILCGKTSGADLTVKLMLSLEKTEIYAGSDPIALTAVTRGMNVQLTWKLVGPGHIEGTGIAVIYVVPDHIEGESAEAVITVTAKDKTGREVTDTVKFIILPESDIQPPSIDEAFPDDSSSKKKTSTSTKVALGAGAVALLGGGIVMATQDGNGHGSNSDDSTPSLSGTWIGNIISEDDITGERLILNLRLVLTQKGNDITGSGSLETVPIEIVTGIYIYPSVSLTLDSFGAPPAYFQGTFSDANTIAGSVDGSGFTNDPLTLKRQ